ncbi:MAG: hypothetical protein WAX69_00120 [Victivallales bacterium]
MKNKLTITPNDFTGTQTERIKSALATLKSRGGGTLELGIDIVTQPDTNTWLISESIILPSDTTLFLNRSRLKLADGIFDTIIRNEGIVVDQRNPNGMACELRQNSNIKIIGSGVDSASIEGPDAPHAAPHPMRGGESIPWTGDFYGWRTISILMANCHNYEIGGFAMRKTTCWAISQEHGCENMHIHDIDFHTTVKNGDGIDFRKGCRNGRVENIAGACSDDIVACTALLGKNNYPRKSGVYPGEHYLYPLQVGGDESNALGDTIENMTINNIRASSIGHVIICLAAGGAKVRNITARDIEDGMAYKTMNTVAVYTGYGKGANMGDINGIHMENIISNNSPTALLINTPLLDSSFINIEQRVPGGKTHEISPEYVKQMDNVRIAP